ncbi:unnamed protein product, partial [Mycena citricolor]
VYSPSNSHHPLTPDLARSVPISAAPPGPMRPRVHPARAALYHSLWMRPLGACRARTAMCAPGPVLGRRAALPRPVPLLWCDEVDSLTEAPRRRFVALRQIHRACVTQSERRRGIVRRGGRRHRPAVRASLRQGRRRGRHQ